MAPSSFLKNLTAEGAKENDLLFFFKDAKSGIVADSSYPLLESLCEEGKLCKVFAVNQKKIDCFYFHPENLPDIKLVAYHPSFGTGFVLERDLGIKQVKRLTEDVAITLKNSYYLKEMVQKAFDSDESGVIIKTYNEFLKHAAQDVIEQAQSVMKKMLQEKAEFPFILTSFLQYDLVRNHYDDSLIKSDLWSVIVMIHDKIKEIEAFEFDPEAHRFDGFSYQNYLHCLIQMSELNGMAHPDVLLLALLNISEKSKILSEDDETKKIKDRMAMIFSPFAERLGLTGIADSFQDCTLSKKSRNALLGAIKEVYGRDYKELETYLFEHLKPLVENALEGKVFSYKINARIKTLFSLKEKLESQLDKFVIRDYSEKQLKQAYIKMLENLDTEISEKGKSQAIWDLLGLQVVFDIHPLIRNQHVGVVQNNDEMGQSFIFEIQNTIKSLIRERIGQEVVRDNGKESGKPVIFMEKDKTLDKNGYIETKIMVSWKEDEKMYRSEIQVMNNMDYAIQRHGSIAHWKYKIKDKGFSIDTDILNRLQFTLTSNYREDFKLLAKELSQDIYVSIMQYGSGHKGGRHYLRLPAGSIAADAVSSRTLDYPSLRVEEILRQGKSSAKLELTSPLYPGDQLEIHADDFKRDLSGDEFGEVSRKAKKIRTKLLALNLSPHPGDLVKIQKQFSKIIDSNTILKGINLYDFIQNSMRLKDKEEIFLLAFAINGNTSYLLHFVENYMKENLGMSIDSLSLKDMDFIFLTPSERGYDRGKKNLHIFSKILLAELIGKRTLEKVLGEDFDLDTEKTERMEYVAKKLGLSHTSELYPRLAFRVLTLEEVLLFYNHAFSTHQLVIQQKGQIQDQVKDKVLKMVKEFGYIFEYASRIHRTNEAIEIDLLIPSLTMEGEDGRKAFLRERETIQSVYHQVNEKLKDLFGSEEVEISVREANAPSDVELNLDYKKFKQQLKKRNLKVNTAYERSEDYERLLKIFFKKYNIPFVFRATNNSGICFKLIMNEKDNLQWLNKTLASFLADQIFYSREAGVSRPYDKILSNCIYLTRNTYGRELLFEAAA